jgi:hypothetical protein
MQAGVSDYEVGEYPIRCCDTDAGFAACELGGIAIKNVPCDLRPIFDGEMLGLMSALMHESLHLGQDWPPPVMPTRIQPTTDDIGQRIQFQQNEIAASKAEKKRLENLFQVFSWMEFHNGEPPPDDERQGFKKLPLTLAIVKKFKKEVPGPERADKAKEISGKLASILVDQVCLTLKCREAVKGALDQLLIDVRDNPGDFRAAASRFRRAIQGNRNASGWFRQLGSAVFNGLFKTDISAGGIDGDTNTVRQYLGTASGSVSIPLDYITDTIVLDDDSLLVVGANEGADTGTIFEFEDGDGDGFLEQETMSVRLNHMYLAASNSFCRGGDGDLYLLNRDSLMFFRLDESMPTIGIQYQGTMGDPAVDDINHIAVSNDGLSVVGYSYADSALFPNVGWVKSTRASRSEFFGVAADYSWTEEASFTKM